MNFEIFIPTNILFGNGKISTIGEICTQFGKRVLIVTMKPLVDLGLLSGMLQSLEAAGISYVILDKIDPEPIAQDLDILKSEIESAEADMIIGFGGGSCLDASKAVAIIATNPGSIWDYIDLRGRPPQPLINRPLPIIAVTTTSGTGAEVTMNSVLTNRETTQKATIKFPSLFPRFAIVDPELTCSLNPILTGMTGFDAFAHALESFINSARRSPFSDMVSSHAMEIIHSNLPRTITNGDDMEGRTNLAWASVLAGISIAHSGTTVTHAIAQPCTARLGLPHGLSVAILTMPVLRHTYKKDVGRFAMIAQLLEPKKAKTLDLNRQAELSIEVIEKLLIDSGMNQTLSQHGAKPEIVDELTEDTTGYMGRGLPQHPVNFDKEEIRTIIKEAY